MAKNIHQPVWNTTLREMIERNGAVEVEEVTSASHEGPRVRQRLRPFLFDAETSELVVERMRATPTGPPPAAVRARVDVYLVTDKVRLVAAHEIREIEPFQLNERQRVTVQRMVRVGSIESAQRRGAFRVDTTALDYDRVTLNQPGPDGRSLRPITGKMVNLSAGGVAIQVSLKAFRDPAKPGAVYDFILPLNDAGDTICAPVRLRRVQSGPVGAVVLGFEFVLDDSKNDQQKVADDLANLTNRLQREQLRKRAGA